MDKKDKKTDWCSYQPYRESTNELPNWLQKLITILFVGLLLSLVFCISGFLLLILPIFFKDVGMRFAVNEADWMALARFLIGGIAGVAASVWWFKTK